MKEGTTKVSQLQNFSNIFFFFLNDAPPPEFSPLPHHAPLPFYPHPPRPRDAVPGRDALAEPLHPLEREREARRGAADLREVDRDPDRQLDLRRLGGLEADQ